MCIGAVVGDGGCRITRGGGGDDEEEALPALVQRIDDAGDGHGERKQRTGGLRGQGGEEGAGEGQAEGGNYAVSLGGLVALLVEGANEQQGIVEGLLRRVNELEQELQRQKGALPKSAAA